MTADQIETVGAEPIAYMLEYSSYLQYPLQQINGKNNYIYSNIRVLQFTLC